MPIVTKEGYTLTKELLTQEIASIVQNGSVTADKLDDGAVITSKLHDDSVSTDKIIDAAVTVDKLATDSVSTDKIIALAVTADKIGSVPAATSSALGGVKISVAGSVLTISTS